MRLTEDNMSLMLLLITIAGSIFIVTLAISSPTLSPHEITEITKQCAELKMGVHIDKSKGIGYCEK